MVSNIDDLKEDVFEVEAGEAIAVYCPWFLRTMTSQPHRLEALMRVIRNRFPCVMVVTEIEANSDAPTFMDRIMEALFFYGSVFDCFEACIDPCNPNRITIEAMYMRYAIRSIVISEGEERTTRHMKVDAWTDLFARFKMVETELSSSCLYQAKLMARKFGCESCCTIDMNGKCLLIGWKGTPISSVSAWYFLQEL
ncbi:DELLA protein GAI1-like [Camellia sinensis]|uniref:DELLA protein GAI1-like n=1 Tax=Camellia sinensis TaxID=4442 RepID=UPI001036E218|nr:DELLA protein GAI1-like [Camellia sinensis]